MAGTIRGVPAAFSRPWRGCLSASSVAPGCYLSAPRCAPPRAPFLFMLPLTRGGDLVILEETCGVSPCRA